MGKEVWAVSVCTQVVQISACTIKNVFYHDTRGGGGGGGQGLASNCQKNISEGRLKETSSADHMAFNSI